MALVRGAGALDAMQAGSVPLAAERKVMLVRADSIQPQPILWLWPGWLPAGKLTILAGIAGAGKTTIAMAVAAAVSAGRAWPDGSPCSQPGNVLIWSGEDALDDTLAPRLLAAGADMSRIRFINGIAESGTSHPFDPAQHMPDLHNAVEADGGINLLIIDPIVSAVSGDMHKANDVRRALQPVVDFAAAHGCAVIGITHFAKGGAGKSPLDRVIGSQAFGALARMVWVAGKQEDGDKRVLARAKSNIAPDDGGFAYALEVAKVAEGIEAPCIRWEEAMPGTAREILGDIEHDENADNSKLGEAKAFLLAELTHGPVQQQHIMGKAKAEGHAEKTIRRAKKELSVQDDKMRTPDGRLGSFWRLPGMHSAPSQATKDDRVDSTARLQAFPIAEAEL